jgi:hypothetical protein
MEFLLCELSKAIQKMELLQQRHDDELDFKEKEWDYKAYDFHLGAREAYAAASSCLIGLKAKVEKALQTPEI